MGCQRCRKVASPAVPWHVPQEASLQGGLATLFVQDPLNFSLPLRLSDPLVSVPGLENRAGWPAFRAEGVARAAH